MRTAVLPAQITSVEDRITANLSLKQVILIVIPIVITGFIYFAFPPINHLSLYKIIFSFLLLLVFLTLSYRINGKIILELLITRGRYERRPKIYVYQKGFSHVNTEVDNTSLKLRFKISKRHSIKPSEVKVNYAQIAQLQSLAQEKNVKMVFKPGKKGGLNVSVYQT